MPNLSIVIICKNESRIIGATVKLLEGITDDIIVYDNGSTDSTREIVKKLPVNLHVGEWEGFGRTKNKAIALAKYDWILSLDSDEGVDPELHKNLREFTATDENTVYQVRFRNFMAGKPIKYGEWGRDRHVRLFNRKKIKWDEELVHEKLILGEETAINILNGFILHHTASSLAEYAEKTVKYAMLNAEKYKLMGRRSSWIRIHLAPAFSFFINYIIKAGFLDGHEGYVCAKMTAYYTFLKYTRLKELNKMIDERG